MMRIVSGKYRHRIIKYPDDPSHTRPTKDRIREAIFSALGDISSFHVLDLYAGSGAMGIESLSRGARKCYFVDSSSNSIKTIKENINALKIEEENFVIHLKDVDALKEFSENNLSFDLVLLDPPYQEEKINEIIELLFSYSLMNESSIAVIETNKKMILNKIYFSKIKEYKYGDIFVYICWRNKR